MKIQHIKVLNMLGARRVELSATTPITLIAGKNGQAKSSIQESIRMAFNGQTLRVKLKKEYGQLVSEGAKTGSVTVTTDAGVASFVLPSAAHALKDGLERGLPDALPYVLNAQAFAQLTEEARRTFLFGLTNCEVTEASVKKILLENDCDAEKIIETLPLLKSITGFPAAAKFAGDKASEARGTWKAIAGENYGSQKAEGWTADKPEVDLAVLDEATSRMETIQAAVGAAQELLGGLKAERNAYLVESRKREHYAVAAEKIPRIIAKDEADQALLVELNGHIESLSAQAGTAPRVGLMHDFGRACEFALDALADDQRASVKATVAELRAPFDAYVAQFGLPSNTGDPDALEQLSKVKASLTTVTNAIANNARDLANARAAKEALDTIVLKPISDTDIAEAEASVQSALASAKTFGDELAKLQAAADAAGSADIKTERAARAHADVAAWTAIADQLKPDGIPAQLLAQALKPVNRALADAAAATGWRQPRIGPDMSITADGRAYSLHSESEQYRIDTMIAVAITRLSSVGILILDRVDMLDFDARSELLVWLADCAAEGSIGSAWLFATLKEPLKVPAAFKELITAHWIEAGQLEDAEAQEQAA